MAWTAPRTWVAGELVTAAIMNSAVRDNLLAVQAGLVAVGFTELDLLGGTALAVSAASHATMYYDTSIGQVVMSLNAGAYLPLGTPVYQNPFIISRWRDVVRS